MTDRRWLLPILYMTLIMALSSIPGASAPGAAQGPGGWISPIVGNALHVPVYAGLSFLWADALARNHRMKPVHGTLTALGIATSFGVFDELYQGLIPGRTTAIGDWVADAIGAVLGCLLFLIYEKRRRRAR